MKILYLNLDRGIPVLGDKGASVHVRSFINAADTLGHEVLLACATLGEGNPHPPAHLLHVGGKPSAARLASECAAAKLPLSALEDPITSRELTRLAYDLTAPEKIYEALAAINFVPDLVYERHALFHCSGAAIAAHYGVPRLLEVNAPLIHEQRTFRGLRLEAQAQRTERASYRGADAIIAVSGGVAEHVGAVLGHSRNVHIVPNGVDLTRFTADAAAGNALRQRLNLGDAPVLGFIGSFKPWHGVSFLLDVFADLLPQFPTLHLLAVGEGPEREAVQARAAALGLGARVIMPGRVAHDEIPAWLSAMTLTAAPYLPQPDFYFSPMKIVESLASGRPVVAPDIGEISTVIRHGQNGMLYAPGDAAQCRAAIAGLLANPAARATMGAAAAQDAAGRGWAAVVGRILTLAPENLPARMTMA
ncbi:glycosyl transferase [Acidocella aquatica]|uniref:Glycosyl transferase n=1 Tax=Acidocella aquatica TaxID=1922313 RepID=A0ABQ6A8Y5_9PROT|nr:glycosyltransferase family 4 protein [Acidocella aquatica]GLR67785.1 glycosyl transferase [Acidocella aquatica]